MKCYNCKYPVIVTKKIEKEVLWSDGSTDLAIDKYCTNCGTLVHGKIKRVI